MERMNALIRCVLHVDPLEVKWVKKDTINDMYAKSNGLLIKEEMSDDEWHKLWGYSKFFLEIAHGVKFE